MLFTQETFARYLRDLIGHLEPKNGDQAQFHFRDALEFVEKSNALPPQMQGFDPKKVRATLIALNLSRSAFDQGDFSRALAYANDALEAWESLPARFSPGTQI